MYCPLGYVIKAPCTHPQRSRGRQWWVGGPQIISCQLTPRPIPGAVSPSEAHLPKPGGSRGYSKADGNPAWGLRGGDTLSGPSQGCPRCDTHHQESTLEHLLKWGRFLPRGMEHIMGCKAKAFWDCKGFIMGCLGEKAKVRKGRDLDDLGRNKRGKDRGITE